MLTIWSKETVFFVKLAEKIQKKIKMFGRKKKNV